MQINIKGKFLNVLHEIDKNRIEISMCLKPLELLNNYTPTQKRLLKIKIMDDDFSFNIDQRIIDIPKGYKILNLPPSAFYFTKAFIYLLDVKQNNGTIIITRKWKDLPAFFDVDEYDRLKQHCNAIDTLEKTGITFLKIAKIVK